MATLGWDQGTSRPGLERGETRYEENVVAGWISKMAILVETLRLISIRMFKVLEVFKRIFDRT